MNTFPIVIDNSLCDQKGCLAQVGTFYEPFPKKTWCSSHHTDQIEPDN